MARRVRRSGAVKQLEGALASRPRAPGSAARSAVAGEVLIVGDEPGNGSLASDALTEPRTAAERWAALVMSAISSEHDPKTLKIWARCAGVSRSVLCETCRLIRVTPHDARDFARIARAVFQCGSKWQPETVLDFCDARTLKKLMGRVGLSNVQDEPTPTIQELFERQHLIAKDNPGLLLVQALLKRPK